MLLIVAIIRIKTVTKQPSRTFKRFLKQVIATEAVIKCIAQIKSKALSVKRKT